MAACREIFDRRGVAEAPVEEIAQAVGIARGLIYREFAAKEELVVLTVAGYLAELAVLLEDAADVDDHWVRADRMVETYTSFCTRYPAFLDGQINLMRRPAIELGAQVAEATFVELGEAMAACLGSVADNIRAGIEAGAFSPGDPELLANLIWTQMLGAMHLARIGVGVNRDVLGRPGLFAIEPDVLVEACSASVRATLGA